MFTLKKSLSFLRKKGPDLFLSVIIGALWVLGAILYFKRCEGKEDVLIVLLDIYVCILGIVTVKLFICSYKSVFRNEKVKLSPLFYVISSVVVIALFILFSANDFLCIDCPFVNQLYYLFPISSFAAVAGEILGKFLK